MKTEKFENVTISYMRSVGEYGIKNMELMEKFKAFLKSQSLYNDDMIVLGIALDNPKTVSPDKLRYDVGIISTETGIKGVDSRKLDDGTYAIFEVEHTQEGVRNFWGNIGVLSNEINIDFQKPIIERYTLDKINNHLCEFCIPLAEE